MERIMVTVHQGPSSTIATVRHAGFTATGEAKRCPNDEDRPDVGSSLAVGRALQILGEDLERYAIARSHMHRHA